MRVLKTVGDINRLRKILTVFVKFGFALYVKKLKLNHRLSLSCRIKCFFKRIPTCSPEELPKKLRRILEELGPIFIKIGQILSVRPDFLPEEYIKELQGLQDKVPSFSYKKVEKILIKELKKPVSEIFKTFEKEPVAAASLSQVHKAVLKNGQKVAVKIQRPNIKKLIEKDLRIISFLASLLERYFPESRNYRPKEAAKEFAKYTKKELDFIIEGKNADRFRYNFKGDKGIKIPKIYWDLTTSKVLTMEFIEGVKLGDHKGMKRIKVNHEILAKNCYKVCSEPIFIHGFFHADPHPGNVWVLKDNIVCLLDFGMVGVITKDIKRKMLLFLKSMLNKEVDFSLMHLLDIAEITELSDVESFKQEATSIIISLYTDSTKKQTFAKTFYKIISNAAKYNIVFPSNMILLAKALVTGETMCMITHPDYDLIESSKPVINRIFNEEFGPKKILQSYQENWPELLEIMQKLPNSFITLMKKIEEGKFNIDIENKKGKKVVSEKKIKIS